MGTSSVRALVLEYPKYFGSEESIFRPNLMPILTVLWEEHLLDGQ